MTKYLRRKIAKYSVYALIVFAAYILQTTPGIFDFYGIKPILVLPACICIAVYEGEFAGGLFGFFFGIFCDSASETILGFNALLFLGMNDKRDKLLMNALVIIFNYAASRFVVFRNKKGETE